MIYRCWTLLIKICIQKGTFSKICMIQLNINCVDGLGGGGLVVACDMIREEDVTVSWLGNRTLADFKKRLQATAFENYT